MEYAIAGYLALSALSYYCGIRFDKAYASKLKRLGYISTEPELYGDEAKLEQHMNFIKSIICYLIPLINLIPLFITFGFESFTDSMIRDEVREGKLKKVDASELKDDDPGYLQRRIEELKEFQEEMGKKNIPKTYSELSYDEKIDVLLHELQLAYAEKAAAEGIDLEQVQPIIEDMPNTEKAKGLQKTLGGH